MNRIDIVILIIYVNEKLSDIEYPEQFSHDGISSYEDGIVVCSSVSWRDKLH